MKNKDEKPNKVKLKKTSKGFEESNPHAAIEWILIFLGEQKDGLSLEEALEETPWTLEDFRNYAKQDKHFRDILKKAESRISNEVDKDSKLIKKRELTEIEKQRIESMKTKKNNGRDLFKTVELDEDGNVGIEPNVKEDLTHSDAYKEFQANVHDATGCVDLNLAIINLSKVSNAITSDPNNTNVVVENMNRMARAMASLEPRDEIEGQLVSQLVVLHEQSMYWMGKAMRTDRVDFANTYLNASTKLVNRHHEALKTLIRYRQGGDQKIIVENVNVNQGGQAIVGHVTGGGSQPKK